MLANFLIVKDGNKNTKPLQQDQVNRLKIC